MNLNDKVIIKAIYTKYFGFVLNVVCCFGKPLLGPIANLSAIALCGITVI